MHLTLLSAADAVKGAGCYSNDLFALQSLDLPGSADMIIRAVTEPVVVPFSPENTHIQ